MNKPMYLGQAILDISKILMYKFGMIALNLDMKIKQSYAIWILMALLCILKQDFYKDIADDAERWFDTSNYNGKDERSLPVGKKR